MSKTTYERGKTLTYPSIYPILTFTPIFGHHGDFVWIEKVDAAWPEHDSKFTFVRSTMHDERVDRLESENAKLRELVRDMCICMCNITDADYTCKDCLLSNDTRNCDFERRMEELGIEVDG